MEASGPQLPTAKPSRGTPGHPALPRSVTPTGLSPSTAGHSSPLRLPDQGRAGAHNPSSPRGFPRGLGLGSPPFGRPYSGDPCWFLFLPLLRCFRSGGSPSVLPRGDYPRGFPSARAYSALAGSPIRGSRVQRPPAPTPGVSPLATPFVGARAEPSTGRLTCTTYPRVGWCGGGGPIHGTHRISSCPSPERMTLSGCIQD